MWWKALTVCASAVLVSTSPIELESRIVNIDQGPVRGYKDGDIYVFYNIPYATAPTGPNKFRPPLPPPTWTKPFEAVQTPTIICPQITFGTSVENTKMQEDCLIANVYVPDNHKMNLPVLVHIHGGAYQMGHSTELTPKNLVRSKKVIVVNFNYRLGPHGFLCLGTKDIPGNAGMKDQVALLRWVQRNIASFGGNPNDVTIEGWSAGGSAVDLIIVSKMAKGLFHKVIPQSGANIASFSVQINPLRSAKNVARASNFGNVDDINALENFYKNVPLSDLWFFDHLRSKNSSVIFSPCIERNLGEEMFLDEPPVNILKRGDYPKVPMLFGMADMEGIFRISFFDGWKHDMNTKFYEFLPEDLQFANENEKYEVAEKIKNFYFKDKPVSEETILSYIDYFTDVMFGYGIANSAQNQFEAGNNQVYLYKYGFVDESRDYIPHTTVRGATHCDQTFALMDEGDETKLSKEYQNMKAIIRELWLNFITTGKPVPNGSTYPTWPPAGARGSPYMYLNSTIVLRGSFLDNRAPFWDDIYKKHLRIPKPPISVEN